MRVLLTVSASAHPRSPSLQTRPCVGVLKTVHRTYDELFAAPESAGVILLVPETA